MTTTIKAHYDGKVIVPDEPVDLPEGQRLEITISRPAITDRKLTGEEIEEQLALIKANSGRIKTGKPIPAEALRRENMYDERL